MNDNPENKKYTSTPEGKREYIEHWLQGSSLIDKNNAIQFSKQASSNSPVSAMCISSTSPILGGKRLASSPIIGSRKTIKRIKGFKELNIINDQNIYCSDERLRAAEDSERQINVEKNCKNFTFEKSYDEFLLETTKSSEHDNTWENSSSSLHHERINQQALLDDIKTKGFPKIPKILEQVSSQFIESTSSEDKSIETTEVNVQEINSDTDKTASDLIEEINTQLIFESSPKHKPTLLSQNISNPSSDFSEKTSDIQTSESFITLTNANQQFSKIFTPTDPIDSTSTLESKINFGKTSYIVQYEINTHRKKKYSKKGSLLNTLLVSMAKEKSNVNLLRHQFYRKPFNVSEKPFILLQISEHLSMMNGIQLLKCLLIEDSMDLLNNFSQNKLQQSVTVVNVPEISNLINNSYKLILKVYEPLTILDNIQLFLHITRFVAIPVTSEKDFSIMSEEICNKNVKVTHKFHCICMEEKIWSTECNSKSHDVMCNIVKMVFDS